MKGKKGQRNFSPLQRAFIIGGTGGLLLMVGGGLAAKGNISTGLSLIILGAALIVMAGIIFKKNL